MSSRWIVVLAWMASTAVVGAILVPFGLPLPWLAGVSVLGFGGLATRAVLAGRRPTPSVTQLIYDIEAEPLARGTVPVRTRYAAARKSTDGTRQPIDRR